MRNDFETVLFDFDGTLAKTMEDNFNAWRAVMADYRIELEPDDYYPLEGMPMLQLACRYLGTRGLTGVDPSEVARKKDEYYLAHHRFAFYPGVEELLDRLRAKSVRIGMVTVGRAERLTRSVPAGFLDRFNAVVTGDEIAEGKPSPAPYLTAAEKLQVNPAACIVVENAPLGVASAKAAGAYCIGICSTVRGEMLGQADEVWPSFQDLRRSRAINSLLA